LPYVKHKYWDVVDGVMGSYVILVVKYLWIGRI
jgi:hypothetical protein